MFFFKNKHRKSAVALVISLLIIGISGCGGSDAPSATGHDFNVNAIPNGNIYSSIANELPELDFYSPGMQSSIVRSYHVDISSIDIGSMPGEQLHASEFDIIFTSLNDAPVNEEVGAVFVFSDLKIGSYYALFLREEGNGEWHDAMVDQVFNVDNEHGFTTRLPSDIKKFEIALLQIENFHLPEVLESELTVDYDGTSYKEVLSYNKIDFEYDGKELFLYSTITPEEGKKTVHLVIGPIAQAEIEEKKGSEKTTCSDAQGTADILQDAGFYSYDFLEQLHEYFYDENPADLSLKARRAYRFFNNIPRWSDSLSTRFGAMDFRAFLQLTDMKLGNLIDLIEGNTWNGVAGTAGFFSFAQENDMHSMLEIEKEYGEWKRKTNPPAPDISRSFGVFIKTIGVEDKEIPLENKAAPLPLLIIGAIFQGGSGIWDIIKNSKSIIDDTSGSIALLLGDDPSPISYTVVPTDQYLKNMRVSWKGYFRKTAAETNINAKLVSRAKYNNKTHPTLFQMYNKGYFIPSFSIYTTDTNVGAGYSLSANVTLDPPLNFGSGDLTLENPYDIQMEARVIINKSGWIITETKTVQICARSSFTTSDPGFASSFYIRTYDNKACGTT